jgi:hypothetical protein
MIPATFTPAIIKRAISPNMLPSQIPIGMM